METKTQTILSYLIVQNLSACTPKADPPSDDSLATEVIQRLAELMVEAQVKISRAYRGWKLKWSRKKNLFLRDIFFDENISNLDEVYIVGDFTSQPWVDKVKMEYSLYFRAFRARVLIKDSNQFKFIVNGRYQCSKLYKTTAIHQNNTFQVRENKSKRNAYLNYTWRSVELKASVLVSSSTVTGLDPANKKIASKPENRAQKHLSFIKLSKHIRSSELSMKKASTVKHPNSQVYMSRQKNKLHGTSKLGKKLVTSTSSIQATLRRHTRSHKLSIIPTKKEQLLSELVTPVIRNPEDIFDKEFFAEVPPLPFSPYVNSRNREELRHFIQAARVRYHKDPKLIKSYSTDTISQEDSTRELKFVSSGHLIPKYKSQPCEDAYFLHENALGIADGVGGWARFEIDCSRFSREIMKRCQAFCEKYNKMKKFTIDFIKASEFRLNFAEVYNSITSHVKTRRLHSNSFCHTQQGGESSPGKVGSTEKYLDCSLDEILTKSQKLIKNKDSFALEPKAIIKDSYSKVKSYGSSTICVCTIQNKFLKVANLGDSGMLLVRYNRLQKRSKVILCTKDQNHAFNTPFQVANIPKGAHCPMSKKNGSSKQTEGETQDQENVFWNDDPKTADTYQARVKLGDIVILGTDGLFDNLFLDDILDIVDQYMNAHFAGLGVHKITNQSSDSSLDLSHSPLNFTQVHASELCKKLAAEARERSKSTSIISPFEHKFNDFILKSYEQQCASSGRKLKEPQLWQGGKRDDIGVVVAFLS